MWVRVPPRVCKLLRFLLLTRWQSCLRFGLCCCRQSQIHCLASRCRPFQIFTWFSLAFRLQKAHENEVFPGLGKNRALRVKCFRRANFHFFLAKKPHGPPLTTWPGLRPSLSLSRAKPLVNLGEISATIVDFVYVSKMAQASRAIAAKKKGQI